MMDVLTLTYQKGLDMVDATFDGPDLTTFVRLDEPDREGGRRSRT